MRILHLDRQRQWSGQQARTSATCTGLSQRGHDVTIVTSPGSSYFDRPELASLARAAVPMRGIRIWSAILRIAARVRRERVDVIDAHDAVSQQVALAARFLSRRVAVVRTKHNHTSPHGILSRFSYSHGPDRIIAISEYVRRRLLEGGVPGPRVETVADGVDCRRFVPGGDRAAARRRFELPEEAFVVGTSSRPSPRKGLPILAGALARLRAAGVEVVWLAAGVRPAEADGLCAESGLPRSAVRAPGLLERVEEIFPALDAYSLPSLDEGLGSAVVEALACATPVVASRVGGIPEVVRDGATGLLVEPGDPARLADALLRLRRTPGLGPALGAAGRRLVLDSFDAERMVDRTAEVYAAAIAGRGR